METQEKVFYCFYKITSSKNYNAGKDKKIHFTDQNVSSYNNNLTMAFLNWPIETYIWKYGDGVFTTRVSLRHTTMFTYSHATTPLDQSERAYYLSYFINTNRVTFTSKRTFVTFIGIGQLDRFHRSNTWRKLCSLDVAWAFFKTAPFLRSYDFFSLLQEYGLAITSCSSPHPT